jgi:hypothetical protein
VVRTCVALTAVVVGLGAVPSGAGATCDDYSNQAEAQRAMDTRDADGDGTYPSIATGALTANPAEEVQARTIGAGVAG